MAIETKTKGLSSDKAREVLAKVGPNSLPTEKKISLFKILIRQFVNPLIIVLLFVAAVSIILGESKDAALVMVVVLINSALGFYQEYKAQKTLEKLKEMLRPVSLVVRDERRLEIDSSLIVPGDVVVLGSGDKIPADGQILTGEFLVNESILTGESEPTQKKADGALYMGSTIVSGMGLMIVTVTGPKTEFGKIGVSLKEIEREDTPLQVRLSKFSKQLALVILFACLFIFLYGTVFQQRDFWEMFRISIILSAAAIPEGLPMATTIVMALGMKRVLEKKGLVKRLLSIETLGSTTVICTDKTGTLTEGTMRVEEADLVNTDAVLKTMALNNNQRSGLELALWEYVKEKNIDPQELFDATVRLKNYPFDSHKKYSSTQVLLKGKKVSLLMGAPDIIIDFCLIEDKEKDRLKKEMATQAEKGFRLLGFCYKDKGDLDKRSNYRWSGLVSIDDPVRPDASHSLLKVLRSGIDVKIVSGDYLKTAESVAKKVGLTIKPENTMEGWEVDALTVEELAKKVGGIKVFARVTPVHKLKIIEALQLQGETVAMTGDGVNDAPALKKADIGVAMNTGTDVAKETADLILMDNSFKVIEAAIEEGRVVFANTKKVIAYVLSGSFADIILIFLAMVAGLPAPLTILQILWIHIICDGPPDLMLGFEPKENDIWDKEPKKIQNEEIFDFKVKFLVGIVSIGTGIFSYLVFRYYLDRTGDLMIAQTMAFTILAVVSLVYIFSYKNLNKSILTTNFFDNKPLLFGVAYGFVLVLAALYIPALNTNLGLYPIGFNEWITVLLFCIFLIIFIEFFLYIGRVVKKLKTERRLA